jgi:hypothetical protein
MSTNIVEQKLHKRTTYVNLESILIDSNKF